jgi:hypothetical protein
VSTFAEIRSETATAAQKLHSAAIHLATPDPAKARPDAIHLSQIELLVQQLFFRHGAAHVRHVGFCCVETTSAVSALCFDVASSLASQGDYDIALVDVTLGTTSLHTDLELGDPGPGESSWPIAPHLWIVEREHWLPAVSKNITFDFALRLREVLSDFDFSVLRCGTASTLNSTMAKACDGIALVLAANKTRRLVATQIKEQLAQAHIPLLGSILADRKFPVPLGLYRNL